MDIDVLVIYTSLISCISEFFRVSWNKIREDLKGYGVFFLFKFLNLNMELLWDSGKKKSVRVSRVRFKILVLIFS